MLYRWGPLYHQPLKTGDAVRPRDKFYLEIEGNESLNVYVLDQDSMGRAYVLFPIPDASLQNPLPPGSHSRPGTAWEVDSAGGRESILIVASRQPLLDLENELGSVKRASVDGPAEVVGIRRAGAVRDVEPIFEISRRANHGIGYLVSFAGDALTGTVAEIEIEIAAAPGSVWIREIVLENPRD